jgi:hypothetical protein
VVLSLNLKRATFIPPFLFTRFVSIPSLTSLLLFLWIHKKLLFCHNFYGCLSCSCFDSLTASYSSFASFSSYKSFPSFIWCLCFPFRLQLPLTHVLSSIHVWVFIIIDSPLLLTFV